MPLYRGMDRSALDLAYNNVKAEPDYQATLERFRERSDAVYRTVEVRRDISYGDLSRQRFDWLACGEKDAPTFVFIHGGYWQNYTKDSLAFVAAGPLKHDFNVVLVEYTLAPEASMTQIVGEIGLLLDFLRSSAGPVGFGNRPVCLCGHSAGGHLAVLHRDHPSVSLTVAVSGLFDLQPIELTWLNDKLRLTPDEVSRYSPLHQIHGGAPTVITVGAAELPELVRQSQDYAAGLQAAGEKALLHLLPGRTHFSILDDLANPTGMHMGYVARRAELGSVNRP